MKTRPFKNSEVGPIPEDWEVKQIRQCGDVITGSTPPRSVSALWNGDFNWVSAKDFTGKYILDAEEKITEAGKRFCRPLPHNSVLVTCIASIGLNAIAKRPCATNQQINAVVCRKCDYEYFYYQCCYNKPHLQEMAGQTAVPIISKSQFEEFAIAFPGTTDEQRHISAALSDADDWIASLDKLIEKKKLVKQGTMQALFTGKTRLPGVEGKWVERRLGECATIARGASPRPIEAYLTTDVNGLNWVKIGDVKVDAKYIESTKERIIPKALAYTREVLPGDLILSNSMSFGRPYIMRISGCIHDGWLVIQDYRKYFDAEFLYYSLGSEYVQRQYETLAAGSSVLNLNKDIVSKIVVFTPLSIAEQRAIASVLSDMDAAISALAREKSKAEQIKQGMMQELLTGKIRLKGE